MDIRIEKLLKQIIMEKLLFVSMIASCVAIADCGNPDLESIVYEKECKEESGLVHCILCSGWHSLEDVSSKKGKLKDMWIVTLHYQCPYWKGAKRCYEYSFRAGKARRIRELDVAIPEKIRRRAEEGIRKAAARAKRQEEAADYGKAKKKLDDFFADEDGRRAAVSDIGALEYRLAEIRKAGRDLLAKLPEERRNDPAAYREAVKSVNAKMADLVEGMRGTEAWNYAVESRMKGRHYIKAALSSRTQYELDEKMKKVYPSDIEAAMGLANQGTFFIPVPEDGNDSTDNDTGL